MLFFDDIGPLDLAFTLLLTFQLLKWKCQYIVVNISPLDDISPIDLTFIILVTDLSTVEKVSY